jgi:hypothetical protein
VRASQDLPSWQDRSQPSANVLNPAIVAVCIAWCARRYGDDRGEPMPWELAFLVVPLVLHRKTRTAYPRSAATHFAKWANENAEVLARFPENASSFVPYVREGLRYGLRSGSLQLTAGATLTARIPPHTKLTGGTELREIATSAALTGAWFARAGSVESVFNQLGVSP